MLTTDSTPLNPYNAQRSLLYSHIGWMLIKPSVKHGSADISDLQKNRLLQWQHRWYFVIMPIVGYAPPAIVAGLGWGDWLGGFYYAGMWRTYYLCSACKCSTLLCALNCA